MSRKWKNGLKSTYFLRFFRCLVPQACRSGGFAILAKKTDGSPVDINIISTAIVDRVHHRKGQGRYGNSTDHDLSNFGKLAAQFTYSKLGQLFVDSVE